MRFFLCMHCSFCATTSQIINHGFAGDVFEVLGDYQECSRISTKNK